MAKKDVEARDEREEMDADHAELRVYELGFHIDPELPTEEARKVYDRVRGAITKAGTVVAEGEPQKVPLAYTVSRTEPSGRRDFDSSYFSWVAYETDGAGHEAVAALAREEKAIFRFLDIRTDKESALHFSEMQELLAKAPQPEGEEGEVSDTEIDQALKEVSA